MMLKKIKQFVLRHELLQRVAYFYYRWRPIPPYRFNKDTPYYDAANHLFVFQGKNEKIGEQYATAFPMDISLTRAKQYLTSADEKSRLRLIAEVSNAMRLLEKYFPAMLEMMNGVKNVYHEYTFEEVVLSVFCTVLTDFQQYWTCSSIVTLSQGAPIIGQNLDLGRTNNVALAYIVPDKGFARLAHVNPETFWLSSIINEAGLSIVGSSINVDKDNIFDGNQLPQEILADLILSQAKDVKHALAILSELPSIGPLSGGLSFLLSDTSGVIKHLDLTGTSREWIPSENGIWITTNHFRGTLSTLNRRSDPICLNFEKNSIARYLHAVAKFQNTSPSIFHFKKLLRQGNIDGAWFRNAIWPDIGYTTASYLIDMNLKQIEYWLGSDTSSSYCLKLDKLFRTCL